MCIDVPLGMYLIRQRIFWTRRERSQTRARYFEKKPRRFVSVENHSAFRPLLTSRWGKEIYQLGHSFERVVCTLV